MTTSTQSNTGSWCLTIPFLVQPPQPPSPRPIQSLQSFGDASHVHVPWLPFDSPQSGACTLVAEAVEHHTACEEAVRWTVAPDGLRAIRPSEAGTRLKDLFKVRWWVTMFGRPWLHSVGKTDAMTHRTRSALELDVGMFQTPPIGREKQQFLRLSRPWVDHGSLDGTKNSYHPNSPWNSWSSV